MKHAALLILVFWYLLPSINAQSSWHRVVYPGSCHFEIIRPITNGAIIRPREGSRGLFRSTDKGKTWTPLEGPITVLNEPLNSGIRAMRYGSKDSIIVVDGTDHDGTAHAYLSRDLGETWSEIKAPPEGITTAPLIVHQSQVFTFGYFPYRYSEEFNRWDTVIQKPLLLYAQEQTLWGYSDLADSLYKSVDGGQTWAATLPLTANRLLMRGDTMITTYPFRRSFDGGAHWEDWDPPGPVHEIFDDGQHLYISNDQGTFRSTDYFETLETLFHQPVLNVIRLDSDHILASGIWGCYRSVDNGGKWERSNTGIGPSDHGYDLEKAGDYLTALYVVFTTNGNQFVQAFSADYGASWTGSVETPFLGQILKIHNDYFGVLGNQLYRSKNGITQWEQIPFPDIEEYVNLKLATRSDTLLIYANKPDWSASNVWVTNIDVEPLVLNQVATPLPFTPKGHVMHQNVLYITDDFNVRKSANLGQSWQTVSTPGIGGGLYSDGTRLYFIGHMGILYSVNGGNAWHTIPFPDNMVGQLQAVTVGTTALYLKDAGNHIFYQNFESAVWDTLSGLPSYLGLGRVKTIGPYIFVSDGAGEIWTNAPEYVGTHVEAETEAFLVFPNPAGNSLYIRFPNDIQTGNTLRIFSQNGTLVFEQKDLQPFLTLSTNNWATGIYYLVWNTGNGVFNKKVIKTGRSD